MTARQQLARLLALLLGDHAHESPADQLGDAGVDLAAVQPADVIRLEDLWIGERAH